MKNLIFFAAFFFVGTSVYSQNDEDCIRECLQNCDSQYRYCEQPAYLDYLDCFFDCLRVYTIDGQNPQNTYDGAWMLDWCTSACEFSYNIALTSCDYYFEACAERCEGCGPCGGCGNSND